MSKVWMLLPGDVSIVALVVNQYLSKVHNILGQKKEIQKSLNLIGFCLENCFPPMIQITLW